MKLLGRYAALLAAGFLSLAATHNPPDPARFNASTLQRFNPSPEWQRVFWLKDYNTRVVVAGTAMLGVAAGVIGSFTLLRKRALMGDALSHAMLPGIGVAFIVAVSAGGSGKSLPVLLAGAAVSGLLGLGVILLIRNFTRLKEDAALGIVLSVFFGAGVAVLGVIQRMGQGHAAGLESFIYGKTASMVGIDALLIGAAAGLVLITCTVLFKEFKLLCFDAAFAASLGWSTLALDVLMMGLVVIVTVIGLQAVGLILVIALLIIPPAAARFWTEELRVMILISAALGALAGAVGSAASALLPRLPSGAMIVLASACLFGFSLVFGARRGLLVRWARRRHLTRVVRRQHLLRAMYELLETGGAPAGAGNLGSAAGPGRIPVAEAAPEGSPALPPVRPISFSALRRMRSWSPRELRREIRRAAREGLLRAGSDDGVSLTTAGLTEAARVVRNHRLWEMFLITHADIAPSHVDRDADAIEHVLGQDMIRKLEALLRSREIVAAVPPSPHALTATGAPAQPVAGRNPD